MGKDHNATGNNIDTISSNRRTTDSSKKHNFNKVITTIDKAQFEES